METETQAVQEDGLEELTHSAESLWDQCQRKYYWRRERRLKPVTEGDEALYLGGLWADMQEVFRRLKMARDPAAIDWTRALLAVRTAGRAGDRLKTRAWNVLYATLDAYVERWDGGAMPPARHEFGAPIGGDLIEVSDADITWVDVEGVYRTAIVNPATGAASRTFVRAGKVDSVIRIGGFDGLWIHENKLLSDEGDVRRLWTDGQIGRYAGMVERARQDRVAGALYDIAVKPRHRQAEYFLEPEDAWMARLNEGVAERVAKLRAKTIEKKGREPTDDELWDERKRTAELKTFQRKERQAETDEEFRARLRAEHFSKPGAFMRMLVHIEADRMEDVAGDTWETTQQILAARRRGKWKRNTSSCYAYGRECPFVHMCRDRRDPFGDDALRAMFVVDDKVNPELEDPTWSWYLRMREAGFDARAVVDDSLGAEAAAAQAGASFLGSPEEVESLFDGS